MAAAREQMRVLRKYMGDEAVDGLTMADVKAIFTAWLEESKAQGASAGE